MRQIQKNYFHVTTRLKRSVVSVLRTFGLVLMLFLFAFEVHASSHEFTIRIIEDDDFSNAFELSLPPRTPSRGTAAEHSPDVKHVEERHHESTESAEQPDEPEEPQEPEDPEFEEPEVEEPEVEEPEEIEPPEPKEPPEPPEPPEPVEQQQPEPIEPQPIL